MHNFKITNCDTDSISFCKADMSPFTKEEHELLLKQLNGISPDMILWEDDGYYPIFIVLKAKNYIMVDEKGKRTIKGSALKSSTLEPLLKQLLGEFIDELVRGHEDANLINIYHKYIRMIRDYNVDIKDIAKKMQLSPTTFNSTRANETKVIDAIKGTEYKSGDRIYVYATKDDTLKLAEHYDNDYNMDGYLKKLFNTTKRFETILPVRELFKNYALKKNKKELETL